MSLESLVSGIKKVAGIAAVSLALAVGSAKATDYEIIKLAPEDPNINHSEVFSINNNGVVIGMYAQIDYSIRGGRIIWAKNFMYKDGIFKDLNPLSIRLRNYPCDVINDFGEILGRNPDPNLSNSGIYKIDEAIGLNFWGSDMNNRNEVCGYYGEFYRDGEIIDLEFPQYGYALGINDNSQITGEVYVDFHDHAYVWDNNELKILESTGRSCRGYDINNKGEVAGSTYQYPCWWDAEGHIHLIDYEGRYDGAANGINDKGQIVGWLMIPKRIFAFLYENGEVISLNNFLTEDSAFGILERAKGINNKGQIIGYGIFRGTRYECGFLANPIQKPKTLSADLNNDGIVNGFDLAEFGNEWLEMEDWFEE